MDRALRKALEASEEGRAYLAARKAARASRSRRTAGKKAPGREAKKATADARRCRIAAIRGVALARSGERCEFCRGVLDATWELHHILSGGGRRNNEGPHTCAAVCRYCHRQYHGGDVSTLRNAKEWAIVHGLRDALAAIEKRIAKVQEARRRPSVPVRIEVES